MTSQTVFTCDGCGEQKRGQPTAEVEHDLRDGCDAIPEKWSSLTLSVFGSGGRMNSRHCCPGCTRRMLAIVNTPLPYDPAF